MLSAKACTAGYGSLNKRKKTPPPPPCLNQNSQNLQGLQNIQRLNSPFCLNQNSQNLQNFIHTSNPESKEISP
jgi:hypothetical protein